MSMSNKQAIETLTGVLFVMRGGRGNGKSTRAAQWAEAVGRAAAALKHREPRPVAIKGRLFKRRYCPACHERVKKGGRFCHACGQAYREPIYHAPEPTYHIPTPPPPRGGAGPNGHSYYLFTDGSSADHGGGFHI